MSVNDLLEGFIPAANSRGSKNAFGASPRLMELRTDRIDPNPSNREVDMDAVERLAESIRRDGQGQPVLVRPRAGGRYELIAGEHRWTAKRMLESRFPDEPEHATIECVVREMDDESADALLIATNMFARTTTPEERGEAYLRISERISAARGADPGKFAGVPTAQVIADLIGEAGGSTSRTAVNRDMAAARAAHALEVAGPALREEWASESGRLSSATLLEVSRLDAEAQLSLHAKWEAAGRGVRWLEFELSLSDERRARALASKATKSVLGGIGQLGRIAERGYEVDRDALDGIAAAIGELRGRS